jgi:hypothetical protein
VLPSTEVADQEYAAPTCATPASSSSTGCNISPRVRLSREYATGRPSGRTHPPRCCKKRCPDHRRAPPPAAVSCTNHQGSATHDTTAHQDEPTARRALLATSRVRSRTSPRPALKGARRSAGQPGFAAQLRRPGLRRSFECGGRRCRAQWHTDSRSEQPPCPAASERDKARTATPRVRISACLFAHCEATKRHGRRATRRYNRSE